MKKRTNSRIRLLAMALILMLLAGCAQISPAPQLTVPQTQNRQNDTFSVPAPGGYSSGTPRYGLAEADLTVGYVAAPGSDLHPLRGNSRDLCSINRLVFESVVDLDENLSPVPLLADRWEYVDGAWYFYLRDGVVFHDGSPLTAHDVLSSLEDIQLNEATSPYASRIAYIQEMTVVDDLTLRVVGNDVSYMVLYAMTFPVVQRYTLNATLPRGTGPYWYISYNAYTSLRLERNPLWWKRQPYISSINCLRYSETADALTALSLNEIEVLATREPGGALSRQLSDRMTLDYSTISWECLVPNLGSSILSDITVRQAIMYAIDRTTLADTTYLGMAQESEVPVNPGSWLYETQSTQYNYNPERAYQMLKNAGWHDSDNDGILDRVHDGLWEDLAFTLVTYNEPGISIREEAADRIAEQLGRVGIRVTVKTTDRDGMRENFEDNTFDLALVGFNLSEVPDLTFLLGTEKSGNCSEYTNGDMDALLTAAREAPDADSLQTALSGIQMKVVSDLPVMGLFFRTGVLISKVSLGGLTGIRETFTLRGLEFCQTAQ